MSNSVEPIFGSVQRQDRTELDTYNSQVFNISRREENELFQKVMRKYGPGKYESLIKPPETYFSSKDANVYVFIEWMGEGTYYEEFLGEEDQYDRDLHTFEQVPASRDEKSWDSKSVVSLSERLSELLEEETPQDVTGSDPASS